MSAPLTGLLLAAGRARRFGGNKILAALPGGERVGLTAAAVLAAGVERVLVVVDAAGGDTEDAFVAAGYRTCRAADAALGMGHSLAAGVAASADAAGWLIALADMPFVRVDTVRQVADALRAGAVIARPCHAGQAGHPVGFSAALRDALLAVRGDRGAQPVLARHAAEVVTLEVADPGVLRDVDVPTDLG